MVLARPIRVGLDAHVVGRGQTGNETYMVELASALARRSDVETIAYVDRGVSWPRPSSPTLRHLRMRSRYLRLLAELPLAARRDRVQLLHVQYVAPPVTGTPIVATVHDISFIDIADDFPKRTVLRLKATIGATVRKAAVILTLSEFTRQRLIEHYGLPPERVVVTPAGVAPAWRPLPPSEAARLIADAGVGPLPERFVLAVGNMHPRKNTPRLIRAVAAARSNGAPDLHLVLAGKRLWGNAAIDAEVGRAGDGWIHFLGYVPDDALVALMGRATVVAYPSFYEGFGLPVVEALACGAVVVAGNRSSIPEVAGEAACLVDPTSDEALSAGVLQASTDVELRSRLAAAGPRWAARFTWDRCAELTAEAYRIALRPE
jgi:glycosyltransferase involved in cell wall biosynthesis